MTIEERYDGVLAWFEAQMPSPGSELHYDSPFALMVAVVLSAQCTDKRVNAVTPALMEAFPTPEAMAAAGADAIFPYIRSVSYPNNKARHLAAAAQMLTDDYQGELPRDEAHMQRLPGVGRKTAHVLAAVLWGAEVMPVDTHVHRVAARIGLAPRAKTVLQTERALTRHIPAKDLPRAHHWLLLHGRYVCTARSPKCTICGISPFCKYFEKI